MSNLSVEEYRLWKPKCTIINYRHDPAYIPDDKDDSKEEKRKQKRGKDESNE